MKAVTLTLLGSALFALASCSTPPKPLPALSENFTASPAGSDMYRLHYRGDPAASSERILDLGLATASQFAAERGFRYFAVIDEEKSGRGEIHYINDEAVLAKVNPRDFLIQAFPHRPKRVFCF